MVRIAKIGLNTLSPYQLKFKKIYDRTRSIMHMHNCIHKVTSLGTLEEKIKGYIALINPFFKIMNGMIRNVITPPWSEERHLLS